MVEEYTPVYDQSVTRKVIVLSDGTGNSAAKIFKTNVWRLYQALDLSIKGKQVARYDDGVGSSDYKFLAMLGGAVGWGLKRNALDLYVFICRNYRPGDSIYAFGFSRGAFTIRVLLKFILSQGLVSEFYSDDDLRWKANQLYRNFRRERKTRFGLATLGRAIRDGFFRLIALSTGVKKDPIVTTKNIEIRFVGVWDTVDAYGIPIYELKKGIDRYIWPLALEDAELNIKIEKACHAIGIDDKRTTFHPLLWDESWQAQDLERLPISTDHEQLTQVFFAGVHANVGGGYPDDGLSLVPLNWMMKEAAKVGLSFRESAITEVEQCARPNGRLYDSRSGFASYYRFEPRHLKPPRDNQQAVIPWPKVHESVLVRMALGTDAYAPFTLPAPARIVVEDSWEAIRSKEASSQNVFYVNEYAQLIDVPNEYPKIGSSERGIEVLNSVNNPDVHSLELTWDTVWWRRVAYFLTVFVSVALLVSPVYPVLTKMDPFEIFVAAFDIPTVANAITNLLRPFIDLLSGALSVVLPSISAPWVTAFKERPENFGTLALLLVLCLLWGKLVDRRINDRSFGAYNAMWRGRRVQWSKNSFEWRYISAVWGGGASALLLSLVLYLYFSEPVCESGSSWCDLFYTIKTVCRAIVGGALACLVAYSVVSIVVLRRLIKQGNTVEPRGLALRVSNWIRSSNRIVQLYNRFVSQVVPALFAIGVVVCVTAAVNRFAFDVFNSIGIVCTPTIPEYSDDLKNQEVVLLQFNSVCQGTGLWLSAGQRYEILVKDEELDDIDDAVLSDEQKVRRARIAQLPHNSPLPSYSTLVRIGGVLFKRKLFTGFFAVVARVSNEGSQESVLEPGLIVAPKQSGELFLFLNNAVIGVPGLFGTFYRQTGSIKISVTPRDRT